MFIFKTMLEIVIAVLTYYSIITFVDNKLMKNNDDKFKRVFYVSLTYVITFPIYVGLYFIVFYFI